MGGQAEDAGAARLVAGEDLVAAFGLDHEFLKALHAFLREVGIGVAVVILRRPLYLGELRHGLVDERIVGGRAIVRGGTAPSGARKAARFSGW